MGLNANNIKGAQRERVAQPNLEPDVYRGRLVQIIDLGLQAQRPYQGKDKPPVNMVSFTYELADEFMKDEEGNDVKDKPRWLSEDMPIYSLQADKAKSTLRYNAFDPEGVFGGDFSKCLGVPVNITVVNNTVGDKTYDNVGNVAAMSAKKAATMPELINKGRVFDLDTPDIDVFNSFPEWLREKIKSNLNFNGSALQQKLGGSSVPKAQEKPAKEVPNDEADSNNPY